MTQPTNTTPDDAAATTTTTSTSAPPAPPPRDVTDRARRRAWHEASVRLWWLSAVVIALIASYLAVTQLASALADRRLIEQGHAVEATVTGVGAERSTMVRPLSRDVPRQITVRYEVPQRGEPLEEVGWIDARPGESVGVGQKLNIRVDPDDPRRWTDRTRPKAWLVEMTAVALLLPLVVVLLLVALARRASVLRVWRDEPAAEAVVVATAHSAMAPRSRVLRMTLKDGADNRVFSTLFPARAGAPGVGETVWVVAPKGRPGRAVVAKLYE